MSEDESIAEVLTTVSLCAIGVLDSGITNYRLEPSALVSTMLACLMIHRQMPAEDLVKMLKAATAAAEKYRDQEEPTESVILRA